MYEPILKLYELILFKCSEELKNRDKYGNLYDDLCKLENKREIQIEEIYDIKEESIYFLTLDRQSIIDNISKEWFASGYGYDPDGNAKCDFCKKRNNKYFFNIKNTKNGIVLSVGSTCIKNFFKIQDYQKQKICIDQDKKNRSLIVRNAELYGYSQNVNQYFEAEKYFLSLPVLLPFDLYSQLQKTILKLREICSDFNKATTEFQNEYEHYEELKQQSDEFVQNNINNQLICKKREIDWLIANEKNTILESIAKNEGKYTSDTLKFIYCEDFIKDNLGVFVRRNSTHSISFGGSCPLSISVFFRNNEYYDRISFQISLKELIESIGYNCILYDDYTYDAEDLLYYSKIMNTTHNIKIIMEYIHDITIDSDYTFLYDKSEDNILIYRKDDGAILYIDAYNFLYTYKKIITYTKNKIKENLQRIINSAKNKRWISVDEQKESGIYQHVVSLYQKYQ